MASTSNPNNNKDNTSLNDSNKHLERIINEIDIENNYEKIDKKDICLTRYVTTKNNYTNEDEEKLKIFAKKYCRILIYGREIGKKNGTPHLQVYFNLLKRMTYNQLIVIFGDSWAFYRAKKNDLANYRYCSKSDNFYYYESSLTGTGTFSSQVKTLTNKPQKISKKERMEKAWELAKNEKFNEIDKDILLQHGKELKRVKMEWYSNPPDNLFYDQGEENYFYCHNLWIWGETGTGKSFFLTYLIDGINKWWKKRCEKDKIPYFPLRVFNHQKKTWWCGYLGEEIVLINEVNPLFCSWYANEIKEWVDQYPFNAEVKGGNLGKIRPRYFIFTSNFPIEQCFCKTRGREIEKDIMGNDIIIEEDLNAMKRRMQIIHRTKKDKNTLIYWPNYNQLDKYHDNINKYIKSMEIIKSQYITNVVNYENKSILYYCYNCGESQHNCKCEGLDNNNKCHVCFTKCPCNCGRLKDVTDKKGKQPEKTPNKRKTNDSSTSILNTPTKKNKSSLELKPPKTPKKNKSFTFEAFEDIPNINNSFIININNDNVATSTQNNSKSIKTPLNSSIKNDSLERQNAFLYNENHDLYIGEPPTSLDIPSNLSTPSTPNFDSIDDDIIENEIDTNKINQYFEKIENDIKTLENNTNKSINDLPDDQETYIPQFDGADDELIDEYENIFKSAKQKYFIHKQFQLIFKIDEYIKKIKHAYDNHKINEIMFIRQLKLYETKKQKIINQYELYRYKFPDNSNYKNIDICYYCKNNILNQCSCLGEYIFDIPAETFEEKLSYINNRKHITELKDLNFKITNTFKEIMELNDCCFNIWKYKNKIDQLKLQKTNLLFNYPFIKKFDTLGKHYSDKICYYCNYGVKKLCECSGKCIYFDKNGNKFTEDDTLDSDRDFDQWQEQDRQEPL